jgi:hypothetical protein
MTYKNKFDSTGRCSEQGFKAEDVFKTNVDSFFESEIVKANFQEELKHIDFHCDISFKVDVKAVKDSKTIWIEFKNVQGKKGWLYGDCTHIAFERPKGFILVKRTDLVTLCDNLVDKSIMVDSAKDSLYKMYSRTKWGRHDLLTTILPKDLLTIPYISIKKHK